MLSPRLAAIASLVPEGSVVADVGAGHGLLAEALIRSGRCLRLIALDASPHELPQSGLDRRWGDGLAPLRPEDGVDTVIVAGLGGSAIAGIIARCPAGLTVLRWILQPQTEASRLRACLPASGLSLVGERLVEDGGRFYPILVAAPGASVPATYPGLTAEDVLEAGPYLLRDRPPELAAAWERQRERLARVDPNGPALARAERILAFISRGG